MQSFSADNNSEWRRLRLGSRSGSSDLVPHLGGDDADYSG